MKAKLSLALVSVLTISLLSGCAAVSQEEYDTVKTDLTDAQAMAAKLRAELRIEQAKAGISQEEYDTVKTDLDEVRAEVAELQAKFGTEQARVEGLQDQVETYQLQIAEYERQLEEYLAQILAYQYKPTHTIQLGELEMNPAYWNIGWDDDSLFWEAVVVNARYLEMHAYIPGGTDLNDMVIDIWNMLSTEGITSIIVRGNRAAIHESFLESNHTWLLIYTNQGVSYALECTTGTIYTWEQAQDDSQLLQYWEGFIYVKPSDLRADL